MTPKFILPCVLDPALELFPVAWRSPKAQQMLLAIGYQESAFEHRAQVGGPARGYWQFEKGGGVRGVLTHHTTRALAIGVCEALDHRAAEEYIYHAIECDAVLACAFARLLLWTDPQPLPENELPGWEYYLRNWRPGLPHFEKWRFSWKAAQDLLEGT